MFFEIGKGHGRIEVVCNFPYEQRYKVKYLTMQKRRQNQPAPQQQPQKAQRIEDYMVALDGYEVEVHIQYGNTILKLQGTLHSEAKFNIILDFVDEKGKLQRLFINKAFVVMIKPL